MDRFAGRPNRRHLVMFHLSLRAANLILELPAWVLKSIVMANVRSECRSSAGGVLSTFTSRPSGSARRI